MQGHGIQLLLSDMAASPAFTLVAEVVSNQPPGITRGNQVTSSHETTGLHEKTSDPLGDQTDGRFRLKFGGSDEPTHDHTTGILAAARDGLSRDWRIIFSNDDIWEFSGAVSEFQIEPIEQNAGTVYATLAITPADAPEIT